MSEFHWYTNEEIQFIKDYAPGHHHVEIQEAFTEKFWPISEGQLDGVMIRYGITTGFTGRFEKGHPPHNKGKHVPTRGRMAESQFKIGHRPHNAVPVGTEVVNDEGYITVKVAEPNIWKFKHRLMWEQAFGDIPKGYIVVFRDGDRTNCSVTNLAMISRAENAVINHMGLNRAPKEMFETKVLIADLQLERRKKRKHERKTGNH